MKGTVCEAAENSAALAESVFNHLRTGKQAAEQLPRLKPEIHIPEHFDGILKPTASFGS
jgi:hypothetical protein